MSFRNTILKAWFSRRARAIDRFRRHPIETQERMFRYLLRRGRMTEFGDRYDLRHIHTVEQFQTQVETFDYDTFKPYVERMLDVRETSADVARFYDEVLRREAHRRKVKQARGRRAAGAEGR